MDKSPVCSNSWPVSSITISQCEWTGKWRKLLGWCEVNIGVCTVVSWRTNVLLFSCFALSLLYLVFRYFLIFLGNEVLFWMSSNQVFKLAALFLNNVSNLVANWLAELPWFLFFCACITKSALRKAARYNNSSTRSRFSFLSKPQADNLKISNNKASSVIELGSWEIAAWDFFGCSAATAWGIGSTVVAGRGWMIAHIASVAMICCVCQSSQAPWSCATQKWLCGKRCHAAANNAIGVSWKHRIWSTASIWAICSTVVAACGVGNSLVGKITNCSGRVKAKMVGIFRSSLDFVLLYSQFQWVQQVLLNEMWVALFVY